MINEFLEIREGKEELYVSDALYHELRRLLKHRESHKTYYQRRIGIIAGIIYREALFLSNLR